MFLDSAGTYWTGYNFNTRMIIDSSFATNSSLPRGGTGEPGTGKTYMCKGLQKEILKSFRYGNCFKVCTPTHKSALIANATTIFNLFNNSPVDYTYMKKSVVKLKEGLIWIFIDEVSMISSKVWSVIRDIKNIYGFKFVLFGDFFFINYQVSELIIMMVYIVKYLLKYVMIKC